MVKLKNVLISILFISILIVILVYDESQYKEDSTDNIVLKDDIIYFDTLTLKQKIAQMVIVAGDPKVDTDYCKLNIGGIRLHWQNSTESYKNLIDMYQNECKIKLFVAADLEGLYSGGDFGKWNPFYNFKKFPSFSEINTTQEAYELGLEQGKVLKGLGFNINFAPVAEYSDKVYGGRTFSGNNEQVKHRVEEYINGLQKNIFGTCKHYPGRSLMKNTHITVERVNISKEDLELFDVCFDNNITAIMVGHQIVEGALNSNGMPSSVSEKVIDTITGNVLIIGDEVNMEGVKTFYSSKLDLYQDLINSGNDIILDFNETPETLNRILSQVEKRVNEGHIDEKNIDESVRKILKFKGYKIF